MKGKSEKIYKKLFFLVYNLQISHKEEKSGQQLSDTVKHQKSTSKQLNFF